jgi:hypothetical protein
LEESFQKCTGAKKSLGGPVPGSGPVVLAEHDAKMDRVIAALWAAFPEAVSEHDLAERAAPYFRRRDGTAIDPKTVRLWLAGVSLPRAEFIFVLIGMVGAGFFGLPLKPAAGRGAR